MFEQCDAKIRQKSLCILSMSINILCPHCSLSIDILINILWRDRQNLDQLNMSIDIKSRRRHSGCVKCQWTCQQWCGCALLQIMDGLYILINNRGSERMKILALQVYITRRGKRESSFCLTNSYVLCLKLEDT